MARLALPLVFLFMKVVDAVTWGIAGGFASGLLALTTQITAAGFDWPWRNQPHQMIPRLFASVVGMVVAGLVVAALHSQISGEWAAFIQGVTAPLLVRRAMSGIEVTERPATTPASSALGPETIDSGGPDGVR